MPARSLTRPGARRASLTGLRPELAIPIAMVLAGSASISPGFAQTQPECTVSILNRTAAVQPDGTWQVNNVPAGLGLVRARFTCVRDGITRRGQSKLFEIVPDIENGFEPTFTLDDVRPLPERVVLSTPTPILGSLGARTRLLVQGHFADGTISDLSAAATGTTYINSTPAVASIDADGLVTAIEPGRTLISARNEGRVASIVIFVSPAGDSDGDGIPDAVEIELGMDPNNDADSDDDSDRDGLSNSQEIARGTNPNAFDTDGDFIGDGAELAAGTDPLDPDSADYAGAGLLAELRVDPPSIRLSVNEILVVEVARQLRVTGILTDGRSVDLTSSRRGTTYGSSDILVANFGEEDGKIFAGNQGEAVVTVTNGPRSVQVPVVVVRFAPRAISLLDIPGLPNSIDVVRGIAFIASGPAGLQIVDARDPERPVIIGALDTPGTARDIHIEGDLAFIADGAPGIRIIDVSDPAQPSLVGSIDTPGTANGIDVHDGIAYVADGTEGLRIVDVSDPRNPVLLGGTDSLTPAGGGLGVAYDPLRGFVVLANGVWGTDVFDARNPSEPHFARGVGTSQAADVSIDGDHAYIALDVPDDNRSGLSVIDLSEALETGRFPTVGRSPPPGIYSDVALFGGLALCADHFSSNAVHSFDVSDPANVRTALLIDFMALPGADLGEGSGIDAENGFVYLVTDARRSRLHIGQFFDLDDDLGAPPSVELVEPVDGSQVIAGAPLIVRVDALDDVGVERVEFLVDDTVVSADTTIPYSARLRVPEDLSTIVVGARAVDYAGNRSELATARLIISDNAPPVVRIASPLDGANAREGTTLNIVVEASDSDGTVSRVLIGSDSGLAVEFTTEPFTTELLVPLDVATVTVTARAVDELGASTDASPIVIRIDPDPAPIVQIVRPLAGTTLFEGESIEVTASATDNVAVESVELRVGEESATLSRPPYSARFIVPSGRTALSIEALATDDLGRVGRSQTLSLQVVPDPLTDVIGRVVDGAESGLAGAAVDIRGVITGTTRADGSFTLENVPTIFGPITVSATQGAARGVSRGVVPVHGGVTDVGEIVLGSSLRFSTSFNTAGVPGSALAAHTSLDTQGSMLWVGQNGSNAVFATPQQLGIETSSFSNLDGLHVLQDGSVLFSTDPFASGSPGSALDSDPTGSGLRGAHIYRSTLDGTNELWIAGEDLGLVPGSTSDIDALLVLPDGSVVFSLTFGDRGQGVPGSPLEQFFEEDPFQVSRTLFRSTGDGSHELFRRGEELGVGHGAIDALAWAGGSTIAFSVGWLAGGVDGSAVAEIASNDSLVVDGTIFATPIDGTNSVLIGIDDIGLAVLQDCQDGVVSETVSCVGVDALMLEPSPREDPGGSPPDVSIVLPDPNETVREGRSFQVMFEASDDLLVRSVTLELGASTRTIDFPRPEETVTFTAPLSSGPSTLRATAMDLAGNESVSEIPVFIEAAPLTTITGTVVGIDGASIAAAVVTLGESTLTATTAANGTFSFSGVKVVRDEFFVTGRKVIGDRAHVARSLHVAAVPGSTTNIGTLVLKTLSIVGYYDTIDRRGLAEQRAPIEAAGFQPIAITDLATSFENFEILFIQNPSNSNYAPSYLAQHPRILQWVTEGGVLVFHDQFVTNAASLLPQPSPIFVRGNTRGIDVVDATTSVTDGPGGRIDDTTLDNEDDSTSRGFAIGSTLPPGARAILSRDDPDQVILFSMPSGLGHIIWSSIPLSSFLLPSASPGGVAKSMRNIYAPNVLEYAHDLR
jgi:hypothetical protein